jgi:hypothetical protein
MPNNSQVQMSPQDELLRLTGTAGNPFETVTASGNGTGKFFGADHSFRLRAVVAGTVSGTNPTLDVKLQDSADGVTYADMGYSFAQLTASQAVNTGSLAAFPVLSGVTASGRPWVRVVKTIGGSASPSFGSFAVLFEPAIPF